MASRFTAFAAAFAFASFASAQYTITDLGVLPGGTASYAYDINGSGEVVGFSTTPNGARGFIWDQTNGMRSLGVLRNDLTSFALGINDSSMATGYSGSSVMRTGFDWKQPTGLHDLGTYGDDEISLGIDINNSGQSVGVSGFDGGVKRAFIYDPVSGMTDLGFLNGVGTFARGINASAQVVGHTTVSDTSAFIWDGSMSALPNLAGGDTSTAYSINDSGTAVGWSTDALGERHAVVWRTGGVLPHSIDGSLSNWFGAEAHDINSQGQIVGFGLLDDVEGAFVYDAVNGARSLSELVGQSANGWSFARAQGINDSGQITGYGYIGGEVHGFVASPVPEPVSGLVFLVGAALFGLRRKRRSK